MTPLTNYRWLLWYRARIQSPEGPNLVKIRSLNMTSKLLSTRLGSTNAYFSIRTCVHFKELLGVRMCVQTFFWACFPLKTYSNLLPWEIPLLKYLLYLWYQSNIFRNIFPKYISQIYFLKVPYITQPWTLNQILD